ncbi:MAG: CDP-alcohol phosphatidyltransferase family protein [Simkaniaceae bacterium]|nr:CDP-alcohol phosphatidyltransferase family protein [Simkaniaceae bacterium]
MLDSFGRALYQKYVIDPLLRLFFTKRRLSPSALTTIGLLFGLLTPCFLALHMPFSACLALLLSGFFDTLDGSVARQQGTGSERGALFDILSDRIVESAVITGFYLYDPERALLCLLMFASTLLCITSFLTVGIFTENLSEKSFHYSPGLIERTEAFLFFVSIILFPSLFPPLASLFILLVFHTGVDRARKFYRSTRPGSPVVPR